MKKNLKILTQQGLRITLLLSLLSLTLFVIPSWSQSIKKTDSDCICGSIKEIDSTLKILNDYPDLLRSKALVSQILADERTIGEAERAAIIKVLGLKQWDVKAVKRRIRWLKIRGATWAVGGVAVGLAVIFLRQP
jgi:hypothetical protein